jgi:hypothetical protein
LRLNPEANLFGFHAVRGEPLQDFAGQQAELLSPRGRSDVHGELALLQLTNVRSLGNSSPDSAPPGVAIDCGSSALQRRSACAIEHVAERGGPKISVFATSAHRDSRGVEAAP